MLRRHVKRRSRKGIWSFTSRLFYINPQKQYMVIVVSAIAMATLIFSGLLLFRQSDHGDIMRRGEWLMKQGKVALAVREFERMASLYGNSYEAHLELGKAYMEIGETEKASKEFRAASHLRSGNPKESGASIAISRMLIAQGKYKDAERQLFQAYNARPKNKKDRELLMAVVDLYEDWGDHYRESTPPDYEKAFIKFSTALRFVKTLNQQKPIEEKLVSTASNLADIYDNNKEYDKAIAVLKRTLHYDYTADNLIAIAAMYEQKEDLDKAIYWYEKAYERDPKVISLKLSSMLMRKGKELNEAHLPQQAKKYFVEAQKINETVKLPLDVLYPLDAENIELTYTVDPNSLELTPLAKFDIRNTGNYPINFLSVKVFFLTGEEKLLDTNTIIATAGDPLAPKGEARGVRTVTLKPVTTIPLENLDKGNLRIRIMVAYTDDKDSKWFEIKNAEIAVPEAEKMNSAKSNPA